MDARAAYPADLPARRCVSVSPSETHPSILPRFHRNRTALTSKITSTFERNREDGVCSDDTTIVTTLPGAQSDATSLKDLSLKAIDQSDAWKTWQRKPFASTIQNCLRILGWMTKKRA